MLMGVMGLAEILVSLAAQVARAVAACSTGRTLHSLKMCTSRSTIPCAQCTNSGMAVVVEVRRTDGYLDCILGVHPGPRWYNSRS